jgi:hypothetical protein
MSDVLPAGLEAMRDAAPSQEAIDAAWHRVQLARHPERPRTLDLVERIFEGFVELHGDRAFREDPAIVGGPALLDGRPVMIIGHQKGTDTDSNIFRNFGSPHPEGFRKAQRLMRLAEKLAMPVITFLDTAGAFPGPAAEERGQQGRLDGARGGPGIGLGAVLRLVDDPVDHAEFQLIGGSHPHGGRGNRRLLRVAPQDRGTALGRDDRVDRVLHRQHDVADADGERAT